MSKGNGKSMRPNKYRGACDRCKGQVGAGEGLLAGKVRGSWRVRHVECNHEGARQVGPSYHEYRAQCSGADVSGVWADGYSA